MNFLNKLECLFLLGLSSLDLRFRVKPEATQVKPLQIAPSNGRLLALALPTNIRLGRESLLMTNIAANYEHL
jgi:hypothetical protein